MDDLYETEQLLRKQLADLHDRYRLEAEPIIEALTQIELAKPPSTMILTHQQLAAMGALVE